MTSGAKVFWLPLFVFAGLLLWAWSGSGLNFTEWRLQMECRNMSHFATGAVFGLFFWIIGFWVQEQTGMKAALFSAAMTLLVSLAIEITQWAQGAASDGFDFVDLLWAGIGWWVGQLYHLVTHRWD